MDRRACRNGSHAYGVPTEIGAGLTRNRCKYCGALEIDLRAADGDSAAQHRASGALFRSSHRLSIFDIEHAVSAGLYEVDGAD